MNPIVILNAHSQVLVVSIAEVMVCWVIVGASFESLVKSRGRIASLVVGILTPDIFFGIYHFLGYQKISYSYDILISDYLAALPV